MTGEGVETAYSETIASEEDRELGQIAGMLQRDLQRAYPPVSQEALRDVIEELVAQRQHSSRLAASRSPSARLLTWWKQAWATRRTIAVALAVVTAMATAGSIGRGSIQVIRVFFPEQGGARMGPRGNMMGLFASPGIPFVRYRAISPAVAARRSGLPVAYLAKVPSVLRGTVGTRVYQGGSWTTTNTGVGLKLHSLVRYSGTDHTLIVALFEPSPTLIARYQVLLGEHTVHLTTGQSAWTTVTPNSYQPDQVAFISGRYIVSIASDLPFQRIERIASAITVSPATAGGQLPSLWPAPLPVATANFGVDIALTGTVERYVSAGGKLGLRYSLRIGNRAMGQERREDIALILPPGIAFAHHSGRRVYVIHFGGGNGAVGGAEELNARDPRGFDQGLSVRVTWRLRGVTGERTFYFPITPGPPPAPFPSAQTSATR